MTRRVLRPLLLAAAGLVAAGPLAADTVYLKNGAWIDGIVRSHSADTIQVKIGDLGQIEIPLEEVYEIEKNSRTGGRGKASVLGRELEVEVDPEESLRSEEEGPEDGEEAAEEDSAEDEDSAGEASEEGEAEDDPAASEEPDIDPELRKRIEQLVHDLQRHKSRYRVRAQRHLKAVGAPSIPFLLPLTDHKNELVRIAVFRLFHHFGDDRVIPGCIDALVDPNEYVRDYAHRTLERVTGERLGYRPFSSPRRRELGAEKWRRWWEKEQELLEELERQAR